MGGAVAGVSGTDSAGAPRPKGRPGRKPKGSVPVVVPETPDKPDPNHVLTWRQRKVLQVIRESVQQRGYPPSMREIGEAVYGMHDVAAHAFGATRAAFGNVASDLPQIVQCPFVKAKRQAHGRRSTASTSASAANSPRSARARASVTTRRSSADNR